MTYEEFLAHKGNRRNVHVLDGFGRACFVTSLGPTGCVVRRCNWATEEEIDLSPTEVRWDSFEADGWSVPGLVKK